MENAWDNIILTDKPDSKVDTRRYELIDFLHLQNSFLQEKTNNKLELISYTLDKNTFKCCIVNVNNKDSIFLCMIYVSDFTSTHYEFFDYVYHKSDCNDIDILVENFISNVDRVSSKINNLYNQ